VPPPLRLEIDDALLPIIVQRMPVVPTSADVDIMIAFYERFLPNVRHPHTLIVDSPTDTRGFDAVQRKRVAEWQESLRVRGFRMAEVTAIVLRSALARGGYTAYLWLTRSGEQQKVCANLSEAFDVCVEALRAAQATVPSGVLAARSRFVQEDSQSR
jgi:hypothetical protein